MEPGRKVLFTTSVELPAPILHRRSTSILPETPTVPPLAAAPLAEGWCTNCRKETAGTGTPLFFIRSLEKLTAALPMDWFLIRLAISMAGPQAVGQQRIVITDVGRFLPCTPAMGVGSSVSFTTFGARRRLHRLATSGSMLLGICGEPQVGLA